VHLKLLGSVKEIIGKSRHIPICLWGKLDLSGKAKSLAVSDKVCQLGKDMPPTSVWRVGYPRPCLHGG
jgi:hypothetical protein